MKHAISIRAPLQEREERASAMVNLERQNAELSGTLKRIQSDCKKLDDEQKAAKLL